MKKLLAILIALLISTGCSKKISLNSQELELAGIHSWIVRIDNRPVDKEYFNMLVITPKGIKGGGSGTEIKDISYVKVLLWDLDKQKLKYAIVGPSFASRGEENNPFYGYDGEMVWAIPGSTVKAGDIVCKKSRTNRVSPTNAPLQEDEIGVAFGY